MHQENPASSVSDQDQPDRPSHFINYQAGLFWMVVIAALYVARSFLLPVCAALLLSYALIPFVRLFLKLKIPRILASLLVVSIFVISLSSVLYLLSEPAFEVFSKAPRSLERLEQAWHSVESPFEKVTETTEQINKMTNKGKGGDEVVVKVKEADYTDIMVAQTPTFLGGIISAALLLFFLLAFGDHLLKRVVEVAPRLKDKKRAIETARKVERSVSRYLVTIITINIGLGVVVGASLFLLGFENPFVWGAIATALNFVPYLGAICGVALLALASLGTAASPGEFFLYPSVYFVCTMVEGNIITPLVLGRSFTLNPVFIILALLFFGWLWGVLGALMSVPILVAIKAYAEVSPSTKELSVILRGS